MLPNIFAEACTSAYATAHETQREENDDEENDDGARMRGNGRASGRRYRVARLSA